MLLTPCIPFVDLYIQLDIQGLYGRFWLRCADCASSRGWLDAVVLLESDHCAVPTERQTYLRPFANSYEAPEVLYF